MEWIKHLFKCCTFLYTGEDLIDSTGLWDTNHAIYNNVLKDSIDETMSGIREQTTGKVCATLE